MDGVRPRLALLTEPTLPVTPERWVWVVVYSANQIASIVGPDWADAKKPRTADPASEATSAFGGVNFPNYVPIADREYYVAWMADAFGRQAPGADTVEIDDEMIRAMKQTDEDEPLKQQVLERVRRVRAVSGFVLDSKLMRRFVDEISKEQERRRLGIVDPPAEDPGPAGDPADRPAAAAAPGAGAPS